MKQVYDDSCLPQGFSAAGTYSGLCDSRVRLDLAMIVSRTNCSIVVSSAQGVWQSAGKALLLHNGAALPDGLRGQEIQQEVCSAASQYLAIGAQDVAFVASGVKGQHFRPSRLIDSLETLGASLSPSHGAQVGAVIDNLGDMTDSAVSLGSGSVHMNGMAADGTEAKPGLCILTTDAAATPQQLRDALAACTGAINTEGYTIIALANGMASEPVGGASLAQAMKRTMLQLGFQPALQACS